MYMYLYMYMYVYSVPVAQWLEHCVNSAKLVGSIPREHTHTYWQYKCIAWMHCKSLWIKASAICTVLSVNEYTPFEKYNFKQYFNEHKNIFQNVNKTKFYITSV